MDLGTTLPGLALCALLAGLLVVRFRAWSAAAAGVVALLAAGVAAAELKALFDRPRPPSALALLEVGGASFPSTQAAQTAAVGAAALLATAWPSRASARTAAALAALGVAGVGACMVYLGAHWTTDVLAGWALGALVGALAARLVRSVSARATSAPAG